MRRVLPRFHESLTIPISGARQGIRVLLTDNGIVAPLVAYVSVPRNLRKSLAWQKKLIAAAGMLFDYLHAVPPTIEDYDATLGPGRIALHSGATYLSRFVEAMRTGTIRSDGSDTTGLFWPAMPQQKVVITVRALNDYSDYCTESIGAPKLNPFVPATFSERLKALRAVDHRNQHSMFSYLGRNLKGVYSRAVDDLSDRQPSIRAVPSPAGHVVVQQAPPYFPFGDVEQRLFTDGFRLQTSGPLWEQYNLRDLLIALLCRYGGLRVSEPHHLFVADVQLDLTDANRRSARVLLFHPTDSLITYRGPGTASVSTTTRAEYLKRKFATVARNHRADRRYAGWKDLMFDKTQLYTQVRWFPSEIGSIFWRLWRLYLNTDRRRIHPDNPWAFCSSTGALSTIANFGKAFDRAVSRIGLVGKKDLGTTPHGLRHAYGQSLRRAGVPEKCIQIALHHKSIESQQVYTHLEISEVDLALRVAAKSIRGDAAASVFVQRLESVFGPASVE